MTMKCRNAVLGTLTLGILIICIGCSTRPATEEIEQQNMAIIRKAHADLQRGDIESFKAVISPNYVRHCQAMPPDLQEIHGTDTFFGFIEEFLVAVPSYQDSLSNMIADGDRVAYISTMTGTQTGPMGNLPASGKSFTLVNIIQRLEEGKVSETWISWDNVAFLSQLGFMP
jgi:predicted ester cyclase